MKAFLAQYIGITVSGTAFGHNISFEWGNADADKPLLAVTVAGLSIGIAAGVYF